MKDQELTREQDQFVQMMRALGNPARFKIVSYLAEYPECIVSDIVERTPLAQSTVSQHLKVLRQTGLIRGEIEGPAMNYCLDRDALTWLIQQLRHLDQGEGGCPTSLSEDECC